MTLKSNTRSSAFAEMKTIMDTAESEGRKLTAEERRRWDAAEARLSAAERSPDLALRAWKREIRQDPRARAFSRFVRSGLEALTPEERIAVGGESRAQGDAAGSAGGYLVPEGYWRRISEVMKAYGGLLRLANVVRTTTGNTLPWPNNDDTANAGHWLAENTQMAETDLTFGTRSLGAYTLSSDIVRVSHQLLEDSAFDLDTWLADRLGIRLGRGAAAGFINGTGTGQPLGILSGARVGVTGATGQTTSVTYDNLVDLIRSVDPAYRGDEGPRPPAGMEPGPERARFLCHDSTLGVLRKLKDTAQRPLWQPNVQASDPGFLLGYPVVVDDGMPPMAASAKSILFGNFHDGYVVREVAEVRMSRLVERYADYLQVGFLSWVRLDAMPDDPQAIAAYENSAT